MNVKKAALVCCSNGQPAKNREKIQSLQRIFSEMGIDTITGEFLYADEKGCSGDVKQRVHQLMNFYRDASVDMIFDISGGDLANEILSELDYEEIALSGKMLWGYSDLTCVLNAVYAKTGIPSVLYQVRNLLYRDGEVQKKRWTGFLKGETQELFDCDWKFLQGTAMSGTVIGGNIRCFLKLAGTPYMPDCRGKLLLLEAYSGDETRIRAYLSQLKQMGVFEEISGILLGTFTEMEEMGKGARVAELVVEYVGEKLPVAMTKDIGHGSDSKAIIIGKNLAVQSKI